MKNKTLTLVLVVASFLGATEYAHAERISPFQKGYQERQAQKSEKNSLRRSFYSRNRNKNSILNKKTNTRFKTTRSRVGKTHQAKIKRSYQGRRGYGNEYSNVNRSTRSYRPKSSLRGIHPNKSEGTINKDMTQYEFKKAKSIAFSFHVPKGLALETDTLNWKKGSLKFSNNTASVEVFSTGIRCEGGSTHVRNCFLSQSRTLNKELQESFPASSVMENKTIYLSLDKTANLSSSIRKHQARFFELENRVEKVYQITFLDPINSFLWGLKIHSQNRADAPLSKDRNIQKIINSLFQEKSTPKKRRAILPSQKKHKKTAERRQKSEPVKINQDSKYQAKFIDFEIKIPTGFEITKDQLHYDHGQLVFENDDEGLIIIQPRAETCEFQSFRLIRKCIEDKAKVINQELFSLHKGAEMLRDENMLQKTTFNHGSQQDVGRLYMIRHKGERKALYTMIEPIEKHLWVITIEDKEHKDHLLNDMRKIRKVLSSLFFPEN